MMMLHCGGRSVSFAELQGVPLPEETETYTPVAFTDLVTNAQEVAEDLLTDYKFRDAQYALAAKDQRMFAILNFEGDDPEMNLSLGMSPCPSAVLFVLLLLIYLCRVADLYDFVRLQRLTLLAFVGAPPVFGRLLCL